MLYNKPVPNKPILFAPAHLALKVTHFARISTEAGMELMGTKNSEPEYLENASPDTGNYFQNIVETVRQPLVVFDARLRVMSANRSFYRTFRINPAETEGRLI